MPLLKNPVTPHHDHPLIDPYRIASPIWKMNHDCPHTAINAINPIKPVGVRRCGIRSMPLLKNSVTPHHDHPLIDPCRIASPIWEMNHDCPHTAPRQINNDP